MTREEAKEFFEDPHVNYQTHGYYTEEEEIEANNWAISALSANKGELISRQAILDELEKWDWQELYLPIHFKQILDDIPSVEYEGEWIKDHEVDDVAENAWYTVYRCSECGCLVESWKQSNFCPNCGADMREPKGEKRETC